MDLYTLHRDKSDTPQLYRNFNNLLVILETIRYRRHRYGFLGARRLLRQNNHSSGHP
jgi:hypothetical protein